MGRRKLFGPVGSRREVAQPFAEAGADLSGLEPEGWLSLDSEQRGKLIAYVNLRYTSYLNDFYESANLCVDRYDEFTSRYRVWRYTLITGTGVVAIINLLAANKSLSTWSYNIIPIIAAVAAAVLAVLANIETFHNSAENAHAYRESREMFLDAAREFDRVWSVSVISLGDSAEAYSNAVELYRRIVSADRELRSKFKELTKTDNKK